MTNWLLDTPIVRAIQDFEVTCFLMDERERLKKEAKREKLRNKRKKKKKSQRRLKAKSKTK